MPQSTSLPLVEAPDGAARKQAPIDAAPQQIARDKCGLAPVFESRRIVTEMAAPPQSQLGTGGSIGGPVGRVFGTAGPSRLG